MVGLDDIYDAAFDRELFPALIEKLAHSFGAKAAMIGWSAPDRGVGFQAQFGNDPYWLARYVDTYAECDIMLPLLQSFAEGECRTASPYLQQPEVRASRFYAEYLSPQGIVDNLAVNLVKRPGLMAHLALLRVAPSRPFRREDCERLGLLVPHLRRAVFIQSQLVRAADYAAAIVGSAGARRHSMLLTADFGVVEIDLPLSRRLRLRVGDDLRDGLVGTMVQRAIERGDAVAAEGTDADGAALRLLCEVRALEPNRFGDIASGPAPRHAVYLTLLDQPRVIAFDAMAELFRLTPTELRVLRDAIEHGDLTGIGDRVGMARATARTHLHRIYEKTQTRSFAGLSNLAHRFGKLPPADDELTRKNQG